MSGYVTGTEAEDLLTRGIEGAARCWHVPEDELERCRLGKAIIGWCTEGDLCEHGLTVIGATDGGPVLRAHGGRGHERTWVWAGDDHCGMACCLVCEPVWRLGVLPSDHRGRLDHGGGRRGPDSSQEGAEDHVGGVKCSTCHSFLAMERPGASAHTCARCLARKREEKRDLFDYHPRVQGGPGRPPVTR